MITENLNAKTLQNEGGIMRAANPNMPENENNVLFTPVTAPSDMTEMKEEQMGDLSQKVSNMDLSLQIDSSSGVN